LVCAVALTIAGPRGFAQGDDLEKARTTFDVGQKAFEAGDYEVARGAFYESFEAFPHFRTIFNIALCEENLGNIAVAVEMYQQYVEWPSDVPSRGEVKVKIEQLKRILPADPEPGTPESPDSDVGPLVDQGQRPGESVSSSTGVGDDMSDPSRDNDAGSPLVVPGWIALGTGAAGLAVSAVLLVQARGVSSEMRSLESGDETYDPEAHDDLPDRGRTLEVSGWVTGAAGVVLISTGITFLLLSGREKPDETEGVVGLLPLENGLFTVAAWRF
jgi:hypothetical protein